MLIAACVDDNVSRPKRCISKSKSNYLLKAYNKPIRAVQCGYIQYRINYKNMNRQFIT